MKTIALVGAPGSGKTRLTRALITRLETDEPKCEQCPAKAVGVDSYAQETSHDGEYAIGLDGGYMANIAIAVNRYNNERFIGHHIQPETMITCGTVIETAVYMTQHFERTLNLMTSEEDRFQEGKRFEGCTFMLAVLYMDTFKYDKIFYLPTLTKPEDERWLVFERNLQAAFQAYQAPVVPLVIEEFKDEDDLVAQQVTKVLK